jgi:ATP-dependent DNA helicase RecG
MPRILKAYPKESFIFTANFIRTVFPISREALELERTAMMQPEAQVEVQVDLDILTACSSQPLSSGEIAAGRLETITAPG